MSKSVNILSLFGGHEVGAEAIKCLGWEVENYFSSEVDEYPVTIAKKNHPHILHIGNVQNIQYIDGELYGEELSDLIFEDLLSKKEVKIDLIIGGPPCTDLSSAKK